MQYTPIRTRLQKLLSRRYRWQSLQSALVLGVPGMFTGMSILKIAGPRPYSSFSFVFIAMIGGWLVGALIGVAGVAALRQWLIRDLRHKVRENLSEHLLLVKLMDDHNNRFWRVSNPGCLRSAVSQEGVKEPASTLRRLLAIADFYGVICRAEPGLKAWPQVVRRLELVTTAGFVIFVVSVFLFAASPFMRPVLAPMPNYVGEHWYGLVIAGQWLIFALVAGFASLTAIQKQAVVEALIEIIDQDDRLPVPSST